MSKIRVEQHEPKNVLWWYEQFELGLLDLAPTYQRRSNIWSRFKRAHLIDSIINDFDIPKFYVADFRLANSNLNLSRKPYAVVDGKQRIEAIFGYLNGDFPLNGSALYDEDASISIKGMVFSDLKSEFPSIAAKIEQYTPVVMSIATDDEQKIYEMFVRLNSGEAANSAEKRNAKGGPIPPMVRELSAHPFFVSRVKFDRKRMAEYALAEKMMLIEFKKGFTDTKAGNLDKFVDNAALSVGPTIPPTDPDKILAYGRYQETYEAVIDVLEGLAEAFNPKDSLLGSSGHIPVYYWVVRNYPEVVPNFRDFLATFNAKVLETMRRSRSGEMGVDQQLLTYYTLGRTTNDQQSLLGRYDLLVSALTKQRLIGGVRRVGAA